MFRMANCVLRAVNITQGTVRSLFIRPDMTSFLYVLFNNRDSR